jgi:tetratricopeptide (TPR) repeat protein
MRTIQHRLAAAALFLCAACAHSWGHRSDVINPDKRLAELLHDYEEARKEGREDPSHLVVDPDRKKNEIERLSLEFPRHVPTLMANAALAWDHREIAKTQSYLDRLFSLSPVHADAAVLRAQVAMREGDLPLARRLLEAHRQYVPDHAAVREALSACYYLSKEYDAAASELVTAERLGSPAWRVAFNRGLIAEGRGDAAAAAAAYEASVAANPDYQPARSRLAGNRAQGGVQ